MKENLKDSKSCNDLRNIGEYVGSNTLIAVPVFAFIGILVSTLFKLTMSKDVWFWFFSSIAQTFAALVALVAIFLINRIGSYEAIINKNVEIICRIINKFAKDDFCDDFRNRKAVMSQVDKLIDKFTKKLTEIAEKTAINKLDGEDEKFIEFIKYGVNILRFAKEEINESEQKKEQANKQMRILLEHTVSIIILSIFLIPFGAVNTEDSLMLALWNNFKLKWAIIFGVVGLCIASLYKVESILNEILSKE